MKRILIMALIVGVSLLAGCGGGGGATIGDPQIPPEQQPAITLDKTSITLHPGESATVKATASGFQPGNIEWWTNPTLLVELVSVDTTSSTCRITATNNIGQWTATASNVNPDVSATITVTVVEGSDPPVEPPTEQKIQLPASLSVSAGENFLVTAITSNGLTGPYVNWISEGPEIAVLGNSEVGDGYSERMFTAVSQGMCYIRAYDRNDPNMYARMLVTITDDNAPPPLQTASIALNSSRIELAPGGSALLAATGSGGVTGSDIQWSSTNSQVKTTIIHTDTSGSVCRVDTTVWAEGNCTITARSRSYSDVSASADVHIR